MADLETTAKLQELEKATLILRKAFDEGIIGIKEAKPKKRDGFEPIDVVYAPLPKIARRPFSFLVENLHRATKSVVNTYERTEAWAYAHFPPIYFPC